MIESLSAEQAELVGYTIMANYGPVGTAFYPRHAALFAASEDLLVALKALLDDEWRVGVVPERRPELFDKSDEALKGQGHMIFAKNRQGETKTCICTYKGRILKWEDGTPPVSRQASLIDDYVLPHWHRE
jgi:hypothetical protein